MRCRTRPTSSPGRERGSARSASTSSRPFPEATTNEALAAALREVDVPVLLINGMRDGVISPESGLRAAVNVPHAKAVFFESEGHFIARERPELLVAEIATFLDSLRCRSDGRVLGPGGRRHHPRRTRSGVVPCAESRGAGARQRRH
ncbi:MAG: alpha/beta hydrolase [Dermatophilaceae bacterium]